MKITLNNRPEEFKASGMTVAELLEVKKFTFRMRVIRLNGKLVKKDEYGTTLIADGDNVQMWYLMSGG